MYLILFSFKEKLFVFNLFHGIEFRVVARIFSICVTCYLFSHVILNIESYSKKRKQNRIMIISGTIHLACRRGTRRTHELYSETRFYQ